MAPDLTVRRRQAELMDDPALDAGRHRHALDALARINRVSLAAHRVWREAVDVARGAGGPVRILDVACGGGDVLGEVGRRAVANGVDVELHGCDLSPVALDVAAASITRATGGRVTAHLFAHDVLSSELPETYDVVTASLFLHHLDGGEAVRLLGWMRRATRHRLLVQDLRRTRLGYAFAWVGLHTLTSSDVARVDGLRSVEAAFTLGEVRALADEAGLVGAVVGPVWPQRFVLRWSAC